jgi:hypothetical protein
MEVLSVGGKDYVKASVIARELGYTTDYVGQLCRSRKVNAKLVGRSWYVDRDSIHVHKSSRYRSTQAKSRELLREEIEVTHSPDKGFAVPVHRVNAGAPIKKPAYVAYSEDTAELIPAVNKTAAQNLEVELADAERVSIRSEKSKYVFETPKLPEIIFKGKVKVAEFDENSPNAESTNGEVFHPKWIFGKGKMAKKLAISPVPVHIQDKQKSFAQKLASPSGGEISDENELKAPNPVPSVAAFEEVVQEKVSKLALFGSVAFASSIVLLLLGIESALFVSGDTSTTSYTFAVENLSASAYEAFADFQNVLYLVEFSTNLFIF